MEINIHDDPSRVVEIRSDILSEEYRAELVHQVVTTYQANSRSGTKAQKSRSEVRGGGGKPYRQKGTGRARAGTSRSPLWRGGGVAFAAAPGTRSKKINRKMYRGAMKSILSQLFREGRLAIVSNTILDIPKTKLLANYLETIGTSAALVASQYENVPLRLAAQNLPRVAFCSIGRLDPVSLVCAENLLIVEGAIGALEERIP